MSECAACHLAYPPGLLPACTRQRLITGLDHHHGTDASLEAATVQQISSGLQANAGTCKRVSAEPPQDRITRSAWFERKHSGIDPAVWKLASVKRASSCAACHTTADRGVFDDDLRYPAGMDAAMRRSLHDRPAPPQDGPQARSSMPTTPSFQAAATAAARAGGLPQRRVVDATTRMFHWLFALSLSGAYLTADGGRWPWRACCCSWSR